LESIDWDALALEGIDAERSGENSGNDPILDVPSSCTSGHNSCNSECYSGDDSFSSHSTPSKMVHDGFVDFKNEISDICSMDMENIVIVMDFDDSQKPDEKLTGEEKGDDFIGFGTGQNTAEKLIIECPDILQTAVVSNYRVSYGKV
jgi:hypothetical protein